MPKTKAVAQRQEKPPAAPRRWARCGARSATPASVPEIEAARLPEGLTKGKAETSASTERASSQGVPGEEP